MPYMNVGLDAETYNALVKLAEQNNRSIVGQVRHMLKVFEAMNIQTVEYLPHPPDAKPIPVVTVEK